MGLRKLGIGGLVASSLWCLASGALAAPQAVPPVEPAAPPSEASLALARRYVEVAHVKDTVSAMLKAMRPVLVGDVVESTPNLMPEMKSAIGEAIEEATPAMMDKLLDRAVPIYAEVYTEQELRAMVAFIGSPEGQSMIAKAPMVTAKLMPSMGEILPEFQAELMARVCAKVDCKGTRKALKPSAS